MGSCGQVRQAYERQSSGFNRAGWGHISRERCRCYGLRENSGINGPAWRLASRQEATLERIVNDSMFAVNHISRQRSCCDRDILIDTNYKSRERETGELERDGGKRTGRTRRRRMKR